MIKNICPYCERQTDLEFIKSHEVIVVRGEEINVPVEYFKCSECGHDFEDPQSKHDPLTLAYKEYRRRHGLMQPEEIRELRQRYGLTQKELAKLLGWGEVTLSRYENGALQDETHNTIFQLIKEPHNLLHLIKQKGDFLQLDKREKLISFLEDEIEETYSFPLIFTELFGKYRPDILSGFQKFNLSKLFQVITFFCVGGVLKTKLNKLLFYADFKHYKEYTTSITGMRYVHLMYGPVPDNYEFYYAALQNENVIKVDEVFFGDYVGENLIAVNEPDFSLFQSSEINTLIAVKDFFRNFNASAIKEFSHKEKGYQETKDGQIIPYSYGDDLRI